MTRGQIIDAANVYLVQDGQEPLADWEAELIPDAVLRMVEPIVAPNPLREQHEDLMVDAEVGV
jgi:hypothetical protein